MQDPQAIIDVIVRIGELSEFVDLSLTGFAMVAELDSIHDHIEKRHLVSEAKRLTEYWKSLAERDRMKAAKSKAHMDDGYRYLFEIACVRLWADLEAGVFEIVSGELERRPELLSGPKLRELKGALVPFVRMEPHAQVRHLLQRFEEGQGPALGVERFERLLSLVGLVGPVDAEIAKQLRWCASVRNVLVHKRGKADDVYLKQCPWRSEQVGDQVWLDEVTFRMFAAAASAYLVTLVLRCEEAGERDQETRDKDLQLMGQYLANFRALVQAQKVSENGSEHPRAQYGIAAVEPSA